MVAKRWGVWLLCLGWVACWGGEPRTRGAARVAEPAPAGPTTTAQAHDGDPVLPGVLTDGDPVLPGMLTDADLAAVAAVGPTPAADPRTFVEEPPLPQGAVIALETAALDATEDLSISFGDSRVEVLRTALDAATLMDEPLPAPSISDLSPVPAAPAPGR